MLYYKMSSPYITPLTHARHTQSHSPARHTSPSHSPAKHHESPYTNTTNYSHHTKQTDEDSDTGDSSDSSADEYLGSYEKFLATLELSESDNDEQHAGKKHATHSKGKKVKDKKHTKNSPTKPHMEKHADDPWDQPKKKINMQHIDDALAQPVNNTKYEDEDPAAYVDPDMWDNHKTPNAYEGLSNSSRKALLKLKELAALGGSPKARESDKPHSDEQHIDEQHSDEQHSEYTMMRNTPQAHHTPQARHTPTHSSAHKIRINVGTPQHAQHTTPSKTHHTMTHTTPHKHHASPYMTDKHEIPEESPYTMQDNHKTTEEYNTFKYNEEHPDEDPRNQSPTRRDTHGDFSIGGAQHRSPRKTPARHTPQAHHRTPNAHHTPSHTSAHNNMGRRNTPTYETYKHETPRAETLRQTPSRHTPARNTPPVIHNPEMSDVEESPFVGHHTEHDEHNESNDGDDQAPGSPVKSEYMGDQQTEDQNEANVDDDGDYVETHSPITKNYTGGFGSAFATFGGAW